MKLVDINPVFEERYERMKQWAAQPSLWQAEAQRLVDYFETDFSDLDEAVGEMLASKRLDFVFAAGLENNSDFRAELQKTSTVFWDRYQEPPVDRELQDSMAAKLYFADAQPDDFPYIYIGDGARYMAQEIVRLAVQDGLPFDISAEARAMTNTNFGKLICKHADESGLDNLASYVAASYASATKAVTAIPAVPNEKAMAFDGSHLAAFKKKINDTVGKRIMDGDLDYTLTLIPTVKESMIEGIPYEEYCQLLFEMSDQPWDQIQQAQQFLIDNYLNDAKTVRFTSADGTDITMDLVDEHGQNFTFCNSVIARNVPGSEVFSGMRRDSVNGKIVAKGTFSPKDDDKIVRDLTLWIKDGKIERFEAAEGAEHFQAYLDRDPNNFYFGELGIGTNPHLRRQVLNGLLAEKRATTFHLALGSTYTYTDYLGTPVHVNNGNHTKNGDHWDLTTPLDNGGRIEVDGKIMMDNGRFVDSEVNVLNDGWFAIPHEQRPSYWQEWCRNHPGGYEQVTAIQQAWEYDAQP